MKNLDSESPKDLEAVERVLVPIRTYIRYADSVRYIDDLANGGICLALGWCGELTQAPRRAKEAGKDVQLADLGTRALDDTRKLGSLETRQG